MLTYMHADITILPYIIVGMVNNSAVTMEHHCWGGLATWLGPHRWCHTAALYSITVRTCISCQALTLIKSLSLSLSVKYVSPTYAALTRSLTRGSHISLAAVAGHFPFGRHKWIYYDTSHCITSIYFCS